MKNMISLPPLGGRGLINLVEVYLGNTKVGRLALTKEGLCAFEYDAEYLTNGISISPFDLPLKNGVTLAKRTPFDGCIPNLWNLSGCSIGYKIISYKFFLTSSRPPISSQVTSGISTTVSLRLEGFV